MISGDRAQQHVIMVAAQWPYVTASLLHGDNSIQHTLAIRTPVDVIAQQVDPVIVSGANPPYQSLEGLKAAVYVTNCVAFHVYMSEKHCCLMKKKMTFDPIERRMHTFSTFVFAIIFRIL